MVLGDGEPGRRPPLSVSVGLGALAAPVPTLVFYPAAAPERDEALWPFRIRAARDAPLAPGRFPLLMISHGSGSAPALYRTLACALARQGFVVGVPEHSGNCRGDDRLAGTAELLGERPVQLRGAIDACFARYGGSLQADAVTLIGHSLGGYTSLALAGGKPLTTPHETTAPQPVAVAPDPRVRGVVLLAPATVWFRAPGALSAVAVPVLMLTGEKDEITPAIHGEWVEAGIAPPRLTHRVVPNAGHFSFQSVFPPELAGPAVPPSQDPPGFDRAAFQAELAAALGLYFRTVVLKA